MVFKNCSPPFKKCYYQDQSASYNLNQPIMCTSSSCLQHLQTGRAQRPQPEIHLQSLLNTFQNARTCRLHMLIISIAFSFGIFPKSRNQITMSSGRQFLVGNPVILSFCFRSYDSTQQTIQSKEPYQIGSKYLPIIPVSLSFLLPNFQLEVNSSALTGGFLFGTSAFVGVSRSIGKRHLAGRFTVSLFGDGSTYAQITSY